MKRITLSHNRKIFCASRRTKTLTGVLISIKTWLSLGGFLYIFQQLQWSVLLPSQSLPPCAQRHTSSKSNPVRDFGTENFKVPMEF